jgi:hypothetical protein
MERTHVREIWLIVLAVALLPAIAGAAQEKTKIFITSTSKTDTPKKGSETMSEAESWARHMEIFTAEALAESSPCSESMTPTDVGNLLDHERMRQLLGSGGDPATLASIADSVNAQYLVYINVTQFGGEEHSNHNRHQRAHSQGDHPRHQDHPCQ